MGNNITRSREILITEEYFIPELKQIDLTKLLNIAMELNNQHDRSLQEQFNENFLAENQTWVITQYQINVLKEANFGDSVVIDTRIVEANSFFTTRRYSIKRFDVLLYEVFVRFAGIDIEKRKIVRLRKKSVIIDEVLDSNYQIQFEKLKPFSGDAITSKRIIDIKEEYIDENQHVNNLVYLYWAYKSLPESVFDKYRVSKIEVKYEKEILPHEAIELQTYNQLLESQQSQQIIYNQSQDKIASIIQIDWQRK